MGSSKKDKESSSSSSKSKSKSRDPEEAAKKKALKEAKKSKKSSAVVAEDVDVEVIETVENGDAEVEEMEVDETTEALVVETETTQEGSESAPKASSSKPTTIPSELEINTDLPTPLSKAQLRAARKEAKSKGIDPKTIVALPTTVAVTEGEGEEGSTKKKSKDKKDPSKKTKKINSIWIGNLNFRTTAADLKTWLEAQLEVVANETGKEEVRKAVDDGRRKIRKSEAKRVAAREAALKAKADKEAGIIASAEGEKSEEDDEDKEKKSKKEEIDEDEENGFAKELITRVNLPMRPGREKMGESRGFAYVDFLTPALQSASLHLSERLLSGRKLLIKLGDDHAASSDTRTPKPITSLPAGALPKKQPHGESSTLWMGNLSFDTTEFQVRDMVEENAKKRGVSFISGGGEEKKRKRDDANEDEDGSDVDEDLPEAGNVEPAINPQIPGAIRGGAVSGLKKVRLGQFEDTGRCKGFAFLDFKTPAMATLALANRANHFLNGRKLTLQYASVEATNRSGSGNRPPRPEGSSSGPRVPGSGPGKRAAPGDDAEGTGESSFKRAKRNEGEGGEDESGGALAGYSRARSGGEDKKDLRGKKWEAKGRPRPGAALAMAKRENVGIVEGAGGKKITFD